jgi:hypothetical protein
MQCQLIQAAKVADDNKAEKQMLAFLQNLPAEFFVYRELQLTAAYDDHVKGVAKKKPDFVVVSPATGVISIEVKDWNLVRRAYHWRDQYKITVTDRATGRVEEIDNPAAQADSYLYGLLELLSGLHVFVGSIVAFPRVSRSDFLNRLEDVAVLRNPQSQFFLDLERTLFQEDLDQFAARPERLLERVARTYGQFHSSTPDRIELVHRRLLPSSFRIGDYTERQRSRGELRMLSAEQQDWVFGLNPKKNYLLDAPGSGKTNVLISKAIHAVRTAPAGRRPRILLTTYSQNLEANIRRIFEHKIADDPGHESLREAITIRCIPALMEQIVAGVLGLGDPAENRSPDETPRAYEARLRKQVQEILRLQPDRFRAFDSVFVDEIQDFDNPYLRLVQHLCKTRSFFFVGDIGQKIYERTHNLERLGFVADRVELKKSYRMYRTPRFIAELATKFIVADPLSRAEFAERGYTEAFQYPNLLANAAEILHADQPEEEIASRVQDLLATGYSEGDILVVDSAERLPLAEAALRAKGVACRRGEAGASPAVCLVDSMEVKGLEREVVFVTGIEDLYDRTKPQATFEDQDVAQRKELLSRRKVYVSLTRPLEQLIIYYRDGGNRFVSELLDINRQILAGRQGQSHAT